MRARDRDDVRRGRPTVHRVYGVPVATAAGLAMVPLAARSAWHAAKAMGLSPDDIRRRNFIAPSAMPYTTPLGETYDSGDFAAHLDKAMALADWSGAEGRKKASRAAGKLRGIGMSCYVEACGGGGPEWANLTVGTDGKITVPIGTKSTGQGHETAYSQLVAGAFGIDNEDVRILQGYTADI